MKSLITLALFMCNLAGLTQAVEVNGMNISWTMREEQVNFTISAPLTGWLALGINVKDDIVGTNLIMASISNGKLRIEDQFVTKAGKHLNAETLGGTRAISNCSGMETNSETTVSFSLPLKAPDEFHYNLIAGTKIFLICAYSESDDFNHHSRVRKHIEITL